jgi:hypothetical protein
MNEEQHNIIAVRLSLWHPYSDAAVTISVVALCRARAAIAAQPLIQLRLI